MKVSQQARLFVLHHRSSSVADFFRRFYEHRLRKAFGRVDWAGKKSTLDQFIDGCGSLYDTPPKWVVRVATEIVTVQVPRVPKRVIGRVLDDLHYVIFEMPLHEPKFPEWHIKKSDFQEVILSVFGHLMAHHARACEWLAEIHNSGVLDHEAMEQFKSELSECNKQGEGALLDYLKQNTDGRTAEAFCTVADAQRNTFDRFGNSKETTATPIYKYLAAEWRIVERLGGTTNLCNHLDSEGLLGGGDFGSKLDRVKKIVKRMGIDFK